MCVWHMDPGGQRPQRNAGCSGAFCFPPSRERSFVGEALAGQRDGKPLPPSAPTDTHTLPTVGRAIRFSSDSLARPRPCEGGLETAGPRGRAAWKRAFRRLAGPAVVRTKTQKTAGVGGHAGIGALTHCVGNSLAALRAVEQRVPMRPGSWCPRELKTCPHKSPQHYLQ